jgi:hypothetical protein
VTWISDLARLFSTLAETVMIDRGWNGMLLEEARRVSLLSV